MNAHIVIATAACLLSACATTTDPIDRPYPPDTPEQVAKVEQVVQAEQAASAAKEVECKPIRPANDFCNKVLSAEGCPPPRTTCDKEEDKGKGMERGGKQSVGDVVRGMGKPR